MKCLTSKEVSTILEVLPEYFNTPLDGGKDCHAILAESLGLPRHEAKEKLYRFLYSYGGVAQLLWVRRPYVAMHYLAEELAKIRGTSIKEELENAEITAAIRLGMPKRFCK